MPGTLKIAHFHGDNRAKTTEELQDYDVVLTTYRTLASDWKGRQVLQELEWFRVVLDEGKLSGALKAGGKGFSYLRITLSQQVTYMRYSALDPKSIF